jgi:hypothetical protein
MTTATVTQPRDNPSPSVWRLLFGRAPTPAPEGPRCSLADAMLCRRAMTPVWTVDLFAG